jgi:rhomboid protease GluP
LAANAIVWLLMTLSGGSTDTQVLIRFGAKVPWLIATGEYWRLFAAIFIHIGFMHLLFNGYALYSLGPQIEGLFGHARFLVIYFFSGLAGSVASYSLSESLSAGASGAIFGLIGAWAIFLAGHREQFGRRGQQALTQVAMVILFNLGLTFTVPGIDVWGHLGGLIGGLILGRLLRPKYEAELTAAGDLRLADRNSLRRRAGPVLLFALALVVVAGLGTLRWSDSAQTHLSRGIALLEKNDVEAALGAFERVVEKDPQNAQALFYLGVAYQELEQLPKAAAAYERTLHLLPDLAEARWNLALVYVELNRPQAALAQFRAYLELTPDAENAAQVRGWIRQLEHLQRP